MQAIKDVYGYIRVSTETQADNGYGLETQRSAITKYCKDNNLNLIKIFTDEGISGALGDSEDITKREQLVELLSTLNGINTIVVMNTSRLWRDMTAQVLVSREIRKHSGDIISIEQPTYSLYDENPNDFLLNSIMIIMDQYERMNINMKLAKGRNTKASNGIKPAGRLPYGYEYSSNKKEVLIIDSEAELVRKIFKLYNNKTIPQIVSILNSEGIKTKKNNVWYQSTITKILNNTFYIGIVTHAGKEFKGKHESIINNKLWNETRK